MEDVKLPRVQPFSPLSLPSSSSSISCETHEADKLKDAPVEAMSLPTSAENHHKEQQQHSKCSSSSTTESAIEEKPLPMLHEGHRGGAGGVSRSERSSTTIVHGDCGRERLKRHRVDVAGSVWIPDMWGQEDLLKDWIDCSAFDAALVSNNIMSARSALMSERKRANATGLRIGHSC